MKMPAMERVRLEVRDTRRNSEKPRPKASAPPRLSVSREYSRGCRCSTRNSLSDALTPRPGGGGGGGKQFKKGEKNV